jgi:hypothetical protein
MLDTPASFATSAMVASFDLAFNDQLQLNGCFA